MKRIRLVLTAVVGAILVAFLFGCGQPNSQETGARANRAHETGASPVGTKGAEEAGGSSNGPVDFALSGTPHVDLSGSLKADGQTTVLLPDGTLYEGAVSGGKPSGQGTLTSPNGTKQQGEWRDGKPYRVSGTCIEADGTKEAGTWNFDGTKSGGTIAWTDGREYKGDCKVADDAPELPDGMGEMKWPDGRKYAGQFRNGMMDGPGKMTYPDGKVEDGLWQQGKFLGAEK